MAGPNNPGNRNQRSRPIHRKQTHGGNDLRFGPAPIRWIVFNKIDSKIDFEMSFIVVEATVSEIFGGQTNSSILVV